MKFLKKLSLYPVIALALLGFAVWSLIDGDYAQAVVDALFAFAVFATWRAIKKAEAENERLREQLAAARASLN